MINLYSTSITKILLGTSIVSNGFLGDELVYAATGSVWGGDKVYQVDGDTVREFYNNQELVVEGRSIAVQYLIIGGGGGGGASRGGGGGAGGVRTGVMVIPPGRHNVIIGDGGLGGAAGDWNPGNNGEISALYGVVAEGGGGGAYYGHQSNGLDGASGGGGGGYDATPHGEGGAGIEGQGYPGGRGNSSTTGTNRNSGGGGGAGGPGGDAGNGGSGGGVGGLGFSSSITGVSVLYASGGGGAGTGTSPAATPGGGGKAGNATASGSAGGDATPNTGGGGGAGTLNTSATGYYRGGNGGSGLVIIRYLRQEPKFGDFNFIAHEYSLGFSTSATGFIMSPDGTKLVGTDNYRVFQYNLATPYNINSLTNPAGSILAYTAASNITGFSMSPDGLHHVVTRTYDSRAWCGGFSTPFNVNPPLTYQTSFVFPAAPFGLHMSPDGTRMYMNPQRGGINRIAYYTLSTAWDVSTATLVETVDLPIPNALLTTHWFDPTGEFLYATRVTGASGYVTTIYQYRCSTPWLPSTATPTGKFFELPTVTGNSGIRVSSGWFTGDMQYLIIGSPSSATTATAQQFKLS